MSAESGTMFASELPLLSRRLSELNVEFTNKRVRLLQKRENEVSSFVSETEAHALRMKRIDEEIFDLDAWLAEIPRFVEEYELRLTGEAA